MSDRKEVYEFALKYAFKKIEKTMEELKDPFPFVTINGKWGIGIEALTKVIYS